MTTKKKPERCDHHLMCGITLKENCNDSTCKFYEIRYASIPMRQPKPGELPDGIYSKESGDLVRDCEVCKEQIRKEECDRVLKELTDETKIHNLHIKNGEFEIASEGVIGHQFIRLLTDFYECNGGPNYFTMEASGIVRGKMRRFEITVREMMKETEHL